MAFYNSFWNCCYYPVLWLADSSECLLVDLNLKIRPKFPKCIIWIFFKAIKFSDSQSETQIVNLKDKKTITCEATPDRLSYSWFYNGDRISTTSELQTADFTKDSSGVYTCRVDNSLGTAQNIEPNAAEEKDFQIEIQSPPVVTTDPADEAVVVEG